MKLKTRYDGPHRSKHKLMENREKQRVYLTWILLSLLILVLVLTIVQFSM